MGSLFTLTTYPRTCARMQAKILITMKINLPNNLPNKTDSVKSIDNRVM